ncbi:LytTR family DNA-binding domain-containing protein [Aquimarina sp. AU474]|uniref:LytR/AlgR family response regulator transcription factor n=1 Tax=Aquimarina sp. AU474 TaxID=2108529 RepID=UPI000D6899EC|nr:LytTR family DNA-binding domain-containing protein [Aquimarina sp. AU474]
MKGKSNISCIIVDDEPLARDIIENYISRIDNLELIASCSNALEAFNLITKRPIDLIFLDIQMPEITGIEFLKELQPTPKVIFTTAYSEYAVDAFNLEAVDYLLKPIEFSRFLKAINKVFKLTNNTKEEKLVSPKTKLDTSDYFLYLKVEKTMQKIFLKDIHYIESLRNYIKIKTSDREIVALKSISSIEGLLPTKKFLRVHRSFIIAIDFIDSFSPSEINIKGIHIPVGRHYKNTVKKVLGYY